MIENPFPDIVFNNGVPQENKIPEQTLASQQVGTPQAFKDVASKFGFDAKNMSPNKDLGRVQLLKRLQDQFGDGFMDHPSAKALMDSYSQQPEAPGATQDLQGSIGNAKRTLGALMGP